VTGPIVFELCAERLESCLAARAAGAHRIELCTALSERGLTPSHALIDSAVRQSGLPVHVLLRPRAGNFAYSSLEFALIEADLQHARALGAAGFAVGVLNPDGTVDQPRMRRLVQLAAPLEVTFHQAFDETPSLPQALEDIVATGCTRILSSGGAANVLAGAARLAALVHQAAGRIVIAAGKGLTLKNAAAVAQRSGTRHFHGSILDLRANSPAPAPAKHAEQIRSVIRTLDQAHNASVAILSDTAS
jgi:copper homeostasis protein